MLSSWASTAALIVLLFLLCGFLLVNMGGIQARVTMTCPPSSSLVRTQSEDNKIALSCRPRP